MGCNNISGMAESSDSESDNSVDVAAVDSDLDSEYTGEYDSEPEQNPQPKKKIKLNGYIEINAESSVTPALFRLNI